MIPGSARIALVISSLDGGGAERVLSLLANAWVERGTDTILITLDRSETDRYALESGVRRVPLDLMAVSGWPGAAMWNNLRRIRGIRRAIKAAGPNAILSFGEQTNVLVLLAAFGSGVRTVVSERTDPRHHRVGFLWRCLRRLTYPLADALVVQSQAVADWARSVTSAQRVHVIPNPVRDIAGLGQGRERAKEIVAVGRLAFEKGFDMLLRAFAAARNQLGAWSLVFVGDGPERGMLLSLAESLGIKDRVVFRGWLAEPADALCRASIFVLPSRYEGFPNALLDAMSCGLAVVSTMCAPCREIVTDGFDGLLVPTDSVPALSAAISRLALDDTLRARLAERASAVTKRYELAAVMNQWDRVLAGPAPEPGASDLAAGR